MSLSISNVGKLLGASADCWGRSLTRHWDNPSPHNHCWHLWTTDKEIQKQSPAHYKAARVAESFLRSTPFEDDLKKLSSDNPKLGGSQETFLRSTQLEWIWGRFPSNKLLAGFFSELRQSIQVAVSTNILITVSLSVGNDLKLFVEKTEVYSYDCHVFATLSLI